MHSLVQDGENKTLKRENCVRINTSVSTRHERVSLSQGFAGPVGNLLASVQGGQQFSAIRVSRLRRVSAGIHRLAELQARCLWKLRMITAICRSSALLDATRTKNKVWGGSRSQQKHGSETSCILWVPWWEIQKTQDHCGGEQKGLFAQNWNSL